MDLTSSFKEGMDKPLPQVVRGGRILAVDDNETNLSILFRHLTREGHNVKTALSAAQALEFLKHQEFDLILCDLIMPEVSGFELLKILKNDEKYKNIPVLVLSAMDETEAVVRSIEAGAEDYLIKPFDRTLLRARINTCLDKKRLRDLERMHVTLLHREMNAAAQLQQSILPHHFQTHSLLDIASYIKPALDVGGDFYDYFWISPTKISLVMADVSGKGLTGGLFMAICRSLIKICASFLPDPGACLKKVNEVMCQNNETVMFVTVFYGILDLETSELTFVNASHCPAVHITFKNSNPVMTFLKNIGGPPLGVLEEATFIPTTITLAPNDHLILYTDGVTEATNTQEELFGYEKLMESLKSSSGSSPNEIIDILISDIKDFINGAPQSDDIACAVIHYLEQKTQPVFNKTFSLKNDISEIPTLVRHITTLCEAQKISERSLYHINLTIDEIITNIIKYGFTDARSHDIEVKIDFKDQTVTLEFIDDGVAFNPLAAPPPDTTSTLEIRPIGKLGIHFVKTFSLNISYHREKNFNHLRVEFTKR